MGRSHRSPLLSFNDEPADLRSCANCGGLIEARMRTCPACGRWLGSGTVGLWITLVATGSMLIVLAFFLPWVNAIGPPPGKLLSGYDLAQIAQQLSISGGARPTYTASVALYLIPFASLGVFALLLLIRLLKLGWGSVGRLLVGLAAIPFEISLLAVFFVFVLSGSQTTGWPQLGLVMTLFGSVLVIAAGIALGGPGRLLRLRKYDYLKRR